MVDQLIRRARREWFGAIVFSEQPELLAYVDQSYADRLGLSTPEQELPAGLLRAPLDVQLVITNRCNLNCGLCHVSRRPETDMNLEVAGRILDHLAHLEVFTVTLSGGEPLLHPQVFEIAQHARVVGLLPSLASNGVDLDDAMAEKCRVFGHVQLSFHTMQDLDHLTPATEALQRAGVPIGLDALITAKNFDDIGELWRWCGRQRIRQVQALKFKPARTTNDEEKKGMALTPAQEMELIPQLKALSKRYGIEIQFDCSLFPFMALNRMKRREVGYPDANGCKGGTASLTIMPDGRFKPCPFWPDTFGDIFELTAENWVSHEKLAAFRASRTQSKCGSCEYLDLCNGGCRVVGSPNGCHQAA
jgi:radical SAM protein with 4Fe4S-binding SPASM domain